MNTIKKLLLEENNYEEKNSYSTIIYKHYVYLPSLI